MSILSFLSPLIEPITGLISEAVVDKDKRDEINLRIRQLEDMGNQRLHEELMAQVAVNQAEAGHRSVFIAGWRPAVGWIGAAGLGFQCIVFPLLHQFGLAAPEFDTNLLLVTLGSILGVGAMRSYDKSQGTSNDVLRAPTPPQPAERRSETHPDSVAGLPVNLLPDSVPWAR